MSDTKPDTENPITKPDTENPITKLLEKASFKPCISCGERFPKLPSAIPVHMYDHCDGWVVPGFKEKQWVYYTCSRCGYQNNLDSLGVPRT